MPVISFTKLQHTWKTFDMLAFIMFTESTSVLFHDDTKDAFHRVIPKLYSMGLWDVEFSDGLQNYSPTNLYPKVTAILGKFMIYSKEFS